MRLLPSNAAHNLHVFICRQAGEIDYKISCSKCGQKLLVRDAMAMRRARCPHCQDFLPGSRPGGPGAGELLMPTNRMVRKIILGDLTSCQQALEAVIGHHATRAGRRQEHHHAAGYRTIRNRPSRIAFLRTCIQAVHPLFCGPA
jgi:DNA-directed RNA polymerase subunit RPC12/RpoP